MSAAGLRLDRFWEARRGTPPARCAATKAGSLTSDPPHRRHTHARHPRVRLHPFSKQACPERKANARAQPSNGSHRRLKFLLCAHCSPRSGQLALVTHPKRVEPIAAIPGCCLAHCSLVQLLSVLVTLPARILRSLLGRPIPEEVNPTCWRPGRAQSRLPRGDTTAAPTVLQLHRASDRYKLSLSRC